MRFHISDFFVALRAKSFGLSPSSHAPGTTRHKECRQRLILERQAPFPRGPDRGDFSELRRRRRSGWPIALPQPACPSRRKREFPEAVHVLRETRQFPLALPAQCLVIMILAANAFRRRQFMIRAPRQQPGFHVLVPDVVTGLHLP